MLTSAQILTAAQQRSAAARAGATGGVWGVGDLDIEIRRGGGGGANIIIANALPEAPPGSLWLDSRIWRLFLNVEGAWVQVAT